MRRSSLVALMVVATLSIGLIAQAHQASKSGSRSYNGCEWKGSSGFDSDAWAVTTIVYGASCETFETGLRWQRDSDGKWFTSWNSIVDYPSYWALPTSQSRHMYWSRHKAKVNGVWIGFTLYHISCPSGC